MQRMLALELMTSAEQVSDRCLMVLWGMLSGSRGS